MSHIRRLTTAAMIVAPAVFAAALAVARVVKPNVYHDI